MKMLKSRFVPVYNDDGSTNIRFAVKRSGVYIIKKKGSKEPAYIGYSGSNLYKTITRHFQSWEDRKQVRTTYRYKQDYEVRVIFCTPAMAERLERALIIKLKPYDNPNKLENYGVTKRIMTDFTDYLDEPAQPIRIMEDPPF